MPFVAPLRPDDPRRVGRYRLTGRMTGDLTDRDSAGTFLARLADGATVAITLLGKSSAPDAASRDRFTAEARAARRVAPFCAARILDAGFDGDQPYLVSEFIEGPSVTEAVQAEGPLDPAVLTALAIGMATGLASIHQAGLVHGDFGPDHVVLGAEGPRVVHFSITPPYGTATPAADLLAWAQTVLFAGSGHAAGRAPDVTRLPEPLRNTVSAGLAAEPGTRPPARTVLTALLGQSDPAAGLLAEGTRRARAAGRGVVAASSGTPAEAPPRSVSRRAAWATACVACVAVIVVAATLIATHRLSSSHPARAGTAGRASPAAHTASASPSATPTIPPALAGTWSGTVRQTDPVLAVTVRVQLAAGSSAGTVAYPQLGCSGQLLLVSTAGGTYTLEQGITNGQQNCDNGVVMLTPQAKSVLQFTFRRSGAPSPAGVLAKTAP
jgi:eukaryotic-like serine/threonine-protein kinase